MGRLLPLFKTLTGAVLRSQAIANFVRQYQRVNLVSLCFHRFAGPAGTPAGHSLVAIDESLRWLQRAGFVFSDLGDIMRTLSRGRLPDRPSVVVSIDDGYADLTPAIAVFARHRCPVSVFLATDFIDGRAPLWWDQVQLLLSRAEGSATIANTHGISWSASWSNSEQRAMRGEELIELIKRVREPARYAVIEALAKSVEVSLPLGEMSGYEPLRWDDVRALEREGVRFGPHTHTHPILSSMDDDAARVEIETSWARIRAEVRNPLPILAYPDGTPWSYSARDRELVRQAGLEGAVTMDAHWELPVSAPVDPFQIGRMAYQSKLPDLQVSALHLGSRGRKRYT